MNKLIKLYSLSTLVVLLVAGCSEHGSGHARHELETVAVKTAVAEARDHVRTQRLPGTVHPSEQADVAAKIMATVEQADFTIGQKVSAGQVLVVLKADEIDAKVEQAQAALAQIERNLSRESSLLEQNATTAETVRTLQDQQRLARAQLTEARTMQAYKTIRAPFDGTITAKMVRRGDLASPGKPLLTIDGDGSMEIHVQVPDTLSSMSRGSRITVIADSQEITATLAEWSPAADPLSRSRLAKLDVGDAALRSGQYVGVNWPASKTTSVWIPEAALSVAGQMERVFSVEDGTARLHLVRTGLERDGNIQIIAGLNADSVVIVNPDNNLRDGQPVVVEQ